MTETHFVPDSSSTTGRRVEGPAVPRPPLHPTARRLFGAAWSACYLGAVQVAAFERHIALPPGAEVDAEIDLDDGGSHALRARLNVSMPGVDRETARELIDAAHTICPYSRAVHGNIDVATNLV
ncbi:OsmC family protein [Mycoplana sp. MJR14]|uniref:OsmC family protein n=1 Tax=Mycoplana sp. MJR14 TaxID=3032583 RepID=UPI0023DC2EF0|nr:OsmC family protein [Mycoplana sp. MJR14]MDF1631898.1 OsmC family protein [Mycoplana sp. MJR14]